jgi:hypothetical protein
MLLLTLLLAALPARALDLTQDAIYNGRAVAADGQTWKSTVGLSFRATDGGYYACSGVLLETDVILTAAHCGIQNGSELTVTLFRENSPDGIVLYLGAGDYEFAAHPSYRETTGYEPATDDLAVVVIRNHALPEGFEPAPVQTEAQASASDYGHPAYVVGTGLTEKGTMSDRLYFAQGTFAGYQYGGVLTVSFPGRSGVCGGDSGGPVFVKSGGVLYLSAITNATPTDLSAHCGSLLYATSIDAGRYRWIQGTAARLRAP